MSKVSNIIKITEELENVSTEIVEVMKCLEAIENSMYFASERKDKDMTKPCAAATEIVINILGNLQERVENISYELKATTGEV
ncbi:MAG: hypothetical protein II994_01230 [Lachnospiraceae bacterium]|nr:hypothetical protein [Lachnospiraceae bacterium]